MPDYSSQSNVPWYKYKDYIYTVNVGENVTKLGNYAFYGLEYVRNIRIDSKTLKDLAVDSDEANYGANYVMYDVGTHTGATLTFGPNVTRIPKMLLRPSDNTAPLNITKVVFEGTKITEVSNYGLASLNTNGLFLKEGHTTNAGLSYGYGQMYIIVLPDSLHNISDWSLNANHKLEKLVFGESINKIAAATFSTDEKINTLVIPHIDDPSAAYATTLSKTVDHTVTIYGDSSTETWVNNVKTASGQTNLVYRQLSEYTSSITSNTDITGSVAYNGTFTFTSSGDVKAYYKYVTAAGKELILDEVDMTKSDNIYTINDIKSDIYIEVK